MKKARLALALLALAAPLAAQEGSARGLYLPLNDFELLSSGAAGVAVNGNFVVNAPGFQASVTASGDDEPTGLETEMRLTGGLTLEFDAEADGPFSESLPGALLPLPTFTLGLDVLVQPFALIEPHVSGEAAAGMRVSFVQEFEFAVGLDVSITDGIVLDGTTPEVLQLSGQPEFSGAAEIDVDVNVGIVFIVTWKGIYLGGPYAGASFGLGFETDPLDDPWWTLEAHVDAFLGYYAIGAVILEELPGVAVPLMSANGPLLGTEPSTRWSKALDVDAGESLRGVLETSTGLLAVARTAGDRPWIGGLDHEGELLGAIRGVAQPFGYQRPVGAVRRIDGSTILVGNAAGENGPRLDRVNVDGSVQWSRTFEHPTAPLLSVEEVVNLPGGDFAVVGTATTLSPAGSVAWIGRFGNDGLPIWTTEVDPGCGVTDSVATSIIRCKNGDLAVAGHASFQELDGDGAALLDNNNLWLVRLTADGDLVFGTAAGSHWGQTADCLAETDDGGFLTGAIIQEGGSKWMGLYRFGSDGSLEGATAYHGDEVGVVFYDVVDLAPIEGGCFVLGTVGVGPERDAILALLTDSGTCLWWKTIGGSDDDQPLELLALDDGLMAFGSTFSPDDMGSGTGEDGWILRTDVDGMLHFEDGNGFDAHNDSVWWQDWSDVSEATSLAPAAVPITLNQADTPLGFAVETGTMTELVD